MFEWVLSEKALKVVSDYMFILVLYRVYNDVYFFILKASLDYVPNELKNGKS